MTLSRQLMLSGLIILLCLFLGMITFVVRNTQIFLNEQLASHSQDTATALGLTLTTTMKNNDVVTASRMADAVWDRGYYRSLEIESSQGKPLVERNEQVKVYGVPEWFVDIFKINTEPKEALILDGWKKVGKVKIESNPGFAYKQIWSTFVDSVQWFIVTAVVALIIGGMLLYIILQPLRAITAQAMAICNQQFSIQEKLPWTFDLRLVVEAMNTMSKRLKKLFEEQALASEQLREQAYKDPVTKLGNRRYFDMQFDYLLKDEEKSTGGALLLIEIKNFKEYNDKYGYIEGDQLLQNVANTLRDSCQPYEHAILAHSHGASLIAVLPNKTKNNATEIAGKMTQQFNDFKMKSLSHELDVASVGIVIFHIGNEKKEIISQADMALRSAQVAGANQWHLLENLRPKEIHGAKEWAEIFAKVIQENKVLLCFQETILWADKKHKMFETLMRLKLSDNEIISAGIFMPMAERLNQITALDKLVVENVVNMISTKNTQDYFFVNLSPSSIVDDHFRKWLLDKVKTLGKKAQQLVIELPEYGVINHIERMREFFLKFAALGGKTSIDHYGKSFTSFSYLYNLKLNFLKIDGGFIKNIHENEENQFFVRSLIDIAHSLGISVIAEAVETQAEYNALEAIRVDGVQGYFVGKPIPMGA